jgi:DNA-binding LacI/PurR family transcriptional regulator
MDGEARRLLLVGIDQPDVISSVKDLGTPSLIVNGRDEMMEIPGIAPANERGAALACQHLINLGHSDIAICSAAYRSTLRARILGYRNALERAKIPFRRENFIEIARVNWEDAYAAISGHLNLHGQTFTAILCGNDMVAIGAIKALSDYGLRVPEDCSVVGFDGVSAGVPVRPTLTTVAIDCTALGKLAVESLLAINTSGPVTDHEIACGLRIGQSTDAPPAKPVA